MGVGVGLAFREGVKLLFVVAKLLFSFDSTKLEFITEIGVGLGVGVEVIVGIRVGVLEGI